MTSLASSKRVSRTCEPDSGHGGDSGPTLKFVRLRKQDFPAFYRLFLVPRREPLFLDIYEPGPYPTLNQFIAEFAPDRFWVSGEPASPHAYFVLHDFQREHELANLDFAFFAGTPCPGSAQARGFWDFVCRSASQYKLTRLQIFMLATDTDKIRLVESFGFRKEGVLREHLFHRGRMHDVAVYAWMAEGRRG